MLALAFAGLVLLCGLCFVLRRRIDPLAVAFGSSVLYFAPGFLGSVGFNYFDGAPQRYEKVLLPEAYAAMAIVLLALTATTLVFDRLPAGRALALPFDRLLAPVLMVLALAAGAVSIVTIGPYYLCIEKSAMLPHFDQWYYYWTYAAGLGLVAALAARQWLALAAGLVLIAIDIYLGFRVSATVALIGAALLLGASAMPVRRKAIALSLLLVVGGGSIVMLRSIPFPLKFATAGVCATVDPAFAAAPAIIRERAPDQRLMDLMVQRLTSPAYYLEMAKRTEPFVIQSVLNEVVRTGFSTGSGYLGDQLLSVVPGRETVFRLGPSEAVSFNQLFQPALFPRVPFGMANSPWAQAYAAGGMGMVAIFACGYALLTALLAWAFGRTQGALRGAVGVVAVWFAFYIQRNDLLVELGILKQVLYILLAAMAVAGALWWLRGRASGGPRHAGTATAASAPPDRGS